MLLLQALAAKGDCTALVFLGTGCAEPSKCVYYNDDIYTYVDM